MKINYCTKRGAAMKHDDREVGPEDVRPALQSFRQSQLIYKGRLLADRDMVTAQQKKAKGRGPKRKLSRLLVEIQAELGRIEPSIEAKEERIERERLRPVG